ncbi:hypothetical protein DITRI_Ditri12bG0149800 [Diplodiscus trichospermus]
MYSFNFIFTAKSAMKQLKSSFLSIFRWQTQDDRSTRKGTLRKGHFSVIVLKNGEPKKFFVAPRYLRYPPFSKLLDASEQEYGFNHKDVIVIPCEASELKNFLSKKSRIHTANLKTLFFRF